jgi:hypothetical protein
MREFLDNSTFGEVTDDGSESHDLNCEGSVFRLLLDVESRLRKQSREESKRDYARRRIFGLG